MVEVKPTKQLPSFEYAVMWSTGDALRLKKDCIIDDFEMIGSNSGTRNYIKKKKSNGPLDYYWCRRQKRNRYGTWNYEGDPFYAQPRNNHIFAGKYVLYYANDEEGSDESESSSILGLYIPSLGKNVYFNKGAVHDVNTAVSKTLELLLSDSYVGDGAYGTLVYSGDSIEEAQRITSTFLSWINTITNSEGTTHYVYLYGVHYEWRYSVDNKDFMVSYDQPYGRYVTADRLYADIDEGELIYDYDELERIFKNPDKDMRFFIIGTPSGIWYGFNEDSTNEDRRGNYSIGETLRADKKTVKNVVGQDSVLVSDYLNKINPCIYKTEDYEYDSDADDLWMKYTGDPTMLTRTSIEQIEEIAEGDFSKSSSDRAEIGKYGVLAYVYLLHLKAGSGALWFVNDEYEGGMYVFNKEASGLFYGRRGTKYDRDIWSYKDGISRLTEAKRLILPRIRRGKDIVAYDGCLYMSRKRIKTLNVNKNYADAHEEDYEVGSETNKFDSSNPAMSELVRIDVDVKSKPVGEDDDMQVEYLYKKHVDENESEEDEFVPFIETIGRVIVRIGEYESRKILVTDGNPDIDKNFIRFFITREDDEDDEEDDSDDDDDKSETSSRFGMFLAPAKDPTPTGYV